MSNKMLTFCSASKQDSTVSVRPEDITALYKSVNGTCGFMVRGDGDIQGMGHYFDDVKRLLEEHGVEVVDCGLPFVSEDTAEEKADKIQDIITKALEEAGLDIKSITVGKMPGKLTEPVLSETTPAPPVEDEKPQG